MRLDKTVFLDSFAQSLCACRTFHNYSITDLAERSGIHRNSISAIENRSHDTSAITCARLCFALNVRNIELLRTGVIQLNPAPITPEAGKQALTPYHAYIMEKVGKAICACREARGYSQERLAKAAGIHKNTLWSLEQGLTIPSNYNLFSIYYSLGVQRLVADYTDIILE